MNYTLIILGVILVVVIYVMYNMMSGNSSDIQNIVTLNTSTTNPNVPFSKFISPASSRYYLSFWVQIDSLTAATDIFSIKKKDDTILKVGFQTDATMVYSVMGSTGNTLTEHTIMTNFPIQKWVYVILSIDGNVVDMYIDGKMIRSEKLTDTPVVPDKDTSNIVFSQPSSTSVIHVAKIERNPTPMDPTLAWNKYMTGNGGNSFSNSYGASFTITKNTVDINKFSLF